MQGQKHIWIKRIIISVCAYVCTWGLTLPYVFQAEGLITSNSILAVFAWIVIFLALTWCWDKADKRTKTLSIIPSIILGICYRIGNEFYATGHLNLKNANFYLGVVVSSTVFWLLLVLLYVQIKKWKYKTGSVQKGKIFEFINNHTFLFFFLLIIICWIPVLLAVYPGIYSYDAFPQVLQVIGGQGLNAHHPVLHTLLLNGCFILGKFLTNDYNIGLLIYTLLQMVFMAAVFAYVLKFIRSRAIPIVIQIAAFLFLVFNPIIQIWVVLTTKDTIFAGFFLLVFTDLICMVSNSKEFFESKSRVIRFIVYASLMCLFRNQGIYIIYLLVLFLFIFMKGFRKKCLIALVPVIICVNVFTGPISSGLGIEPANPREALSCSNPTNSKSANSRARKCYGARKRNRISIYSGRIY